MFNFFSSMYTFLIKYYQHAVLPVLHRKINNILLLQIVFVRPDWIGQQVYRIPPFSRYWLLMGIRKKSNRGEQECQAIDYSAICQSKPATIGRDQPGYCTPVLKLWTNFCLGVWDGGLL